MGEEKRTARGGVYFRPSKGAPGEQNGKRGRWWIRYTVDGQHIREGTDALNKTEAVKLRRSILSEIDKGKRGLPAKKKVVLLSTLADEYLEYAKSNKSS